jgi:hypothetical protein
MTSKKLVMVKRVANFGWSNKVVPLQALTAWGVGGENGGIAPFILNFGVEKDAIGHIHG